MYAFAANRASIAPLCAKIVWGAFVQTQSIKLDVGFDGDLDVEKDDDEPVEELQGKEIEEEETDDDYPEAGNNANQLGEEEPEPGPSKRTKL